MSKIYSIKCPKCAAPLNLIGGGRVKTVTCEYCKSQIELEQNYKIVANFTDTIRDDAPFKIGMRGKIEGIDWKIIGFIIYTTKEDINDTWSEFLLFSPIYGYAWLNYEYGKVYFSRRVRDINLSSHRDGKYTIFYKNGHYVLEDKEPYTSVVEYVQGEMTSVIKRNDETKAYDYKGVNGQSLTIEKSSNEIEAYYSKDLNSKKVFSSFGITPEIKEKPIPTIEKQNLNIISSLILILLLLIMYSFVSSNNILNTRVDSNTSLNFNINNGAFLTKITLKSPTATALKEGELILYKGNKEYLRVTRNYAVYKENQSFSGTFKPFAIGANIYLKLDSGSYNLKLQNFKNGYPIFINIENFVIKDIYLVIVLIILFIALIYYSSVKLEAIISITKVLFFIISIIMLINFYDQYWLWLIIFLILPILFRVKED